MYIVPGERDIVPDVFVRRRPSSTAAPLVGNVAVMEREDAPQIVRVASITQREYFIEIVDVKDRERVITTVEILSPTNKASGHPGRETYVRKQHSVLDSGTHLLEIDLLRAGQHTIAAPLTALQSKNIPWDYLICLHRAGQRRENEDEFEVWFNRVRQPLPNVRVPLDVGMPDVQFDLQAVLNRCYDEADYGSELDYERDPVPPLSGDNALWADALLREHGLRS